MSEEKSSRPVQDIIGCKVVDPQGTLLGVVESVIHTAANDVFAVKPESGEYEEILIPAVEGVVISVDTALKGIAVRLPDGLLDIYRTRKKEKK